MAHLTKPERYNIEDTNIALLGSELEKRVREQAGDKESAWEDAGKTPGTETWRIEKFKVIPWPEDRQGTFYDGDSYIVLHTYKKTPESKELSYDLHFWLGEETTQDEAGTAAYKTVELDDHLHGAPVQYREVQSYESPRFMSYFPHFVILHGGVSTGFHHVSSPPPLDLHRLYHIKAVSTGRDSHGTHFITRQVKDDPASIRDAAGDVLVLDKGSALWQFNRKGSAGKERFKAAEFVRNIMEERQKAGQFKAIDVKVFDEGGPGAGTFLADLNTDAATIATATATVTTSATSPLALFRISDATGVFTMTPVTSVPLRRTDLSSSDIFILDDIRNPTAPAVYAWIGKEASTGERRMGVHFAQRYLRTKEDARTSRISVVKVNEGRESDAFLTLLQV
ncbi:fragmin60 [Gautieria morchelliformis]|nr:fragmin60 [Gautieria morchelliformis]